MPLRLKVLLILIMLFFLFYICITIKSKKLSTSHAIIWIVADILVIISIIFIEQLLKVVNLLGIETVSNTMFFMGFIFVMILNYNMSCEISSLNKKIINLSQELSLEKYDNKNEK